MKVPPKRKGNRGGANTNSSAIFPSMKVPPKRKGNHHVNLESVDGGTLNESPSEKEGKYKDLNTLAVALLALNESPSEKEGK